MKRNLSFFLIFILSTKIIFSQSTLVKIYSELGYYSALRDLEQTSDGGFIFTGNIDEFSEGVEMMVLKTDALGEIEWKKILYRDTSSAPHKIHQTSDDGYLLYYTKTPDGGYAHTNSIIKLSSEGDSLWEVNYNEYTWTSDFPMITFTSDDGFICGWVWKNLDTGTERKVQLLKANSFGETIWDYEIIPDLDYHIYYSQLSQLNDHIVFIGGYDNGPHYDLRLLEVDTLGAIFNEEEYHNYSGIYDANYTIQNDSFLVIIGGYWDPGSTSSFDDIIGSKIIKYNKFLNIVWEENYMIDPAVADTKINAASMNDLSCIFLYQEYNAGINNGEIALFKTSQGGDSLWSNSIVSNGTFLISEIEQLENKNYALVGQFFSDVAATKGLLIIIDSLGNLPFAEIKGNVFYDENGNLINDELFGIANQMVSSSPGSFFSSTDSIGNYSMYVYDTVSYQITTAHPTYFYQTSPPAPFYQTVNIDSFYYFIDGIDFAINIDSEIEDLELDIHGSTLQPGFPAIYTVTVNNVGTIPILDYAITITHDALLTFDSTEISYSSFIDQTIIFNLTDINLFESKSFNFYMTLDADTSLIDSTLLMYGSVEPIDSDETPLNNQFILEEYVYGSIDPNSKEVNPVGQTEFGYIDPNTSTLNYTINFQNTGNYPATFVTLIDTIDVHLNFSSIRTISASHPYSMEFIYPNIVIWNFDEIYLPDSTSDYLGSQGFAKFEIDILPDLPIGTVIQNFADIYFDFNPPVRTNTVTSTLDLTNALIDTQVENKIYVYPNPAGNFVFVNGNEEKDFSLCIYALDGSFICAYEARENNKIDIANLANGMYFFSIFQQTNKIETGSFIKIAE